MKLSKITIVLVVALSLAALAVPAGAWWGPLGCGFGVPFATGCGANFASSFQSTTSFSTFGTAGVAAAPFGFCGVPFGLGFGGCGLGFGGLGFGGCGFC